MKKILLITGGYGFVGTSLAKSLRNNYRLWALDLKEMQLGLYEEFFSWESYDQIPFEKIDTIIHLAGKAHDVGSKEPSETYFQVNTALTKKVFDSFLQSNANSFLFFSSVKAAADAVEGNTLTEEVIPRPKGAYGESKIQAETYILSQTWNQKRVYIFRPCMIHGPGNKGNLNLLYQFIRKGIPYPLGLYNNERSFTSIDNLSFLVDQSLSQQIPSGIYNIADDTPLSTNQLIQLIAKEEGKREMIWKFPKKSIELLAKLGDLLPLPFNSLRLQKLTENYVVSNEKIKKALHITALPIKAEEGMQKTLQSFQKKAQKSTKK